MNNYNLMTACRKIVLASALCALTVPSLRASGEGVSGAQFLRIGVDARASALGGAGASASGAQSLFYNPAGLADTAGTEVAFSQVQWVSEVSYSNLAASRKTGFGALGLAVSYLSVPSTVKYDNAGNKLSDSYSASDMAAALGFSAQLGDYASYGLTGKYISSSLDDSKAAAFAVDAGVKWTPVPGRFAVGASLQNAGGELKYETEGAPLPANYKAGCEWVFPITDESGTGKRVSLLADANYLKDAGLYGNFGLDFSSDYAEGGSFSLRGGYRTDIAGDGAGLSLGLGLDLRAYALDYAYSVMGDIGQAHRLTLTVRFGSAS